MDPIRKFSQVVIVDEDNNFYLEQDDTGDNIDFCGRSSEYGELPIDTIIRNLNEKFELIIGEDDLSFIDLDIGEDGHGIRENSLFLLRVDKTIKDTIKKYKCLIKTSIKNLDLLYRDTGVDNEIFKKKLLLALQ